MTTRDRGPEEGLPPGHEIFRLLFEIGPDALFLHDLEGRIVEVNRAACASLGYARRELLQLPFATIFQVEEPEALSKLWARVLQGEKLTLPGLHRRKDVTTFPIEVHLSSLEDAGSPYILVSARDLTGRRQADNALLTSDAFLNSIIDQSPYPMWISDDQGTLIRINRACLDLLHLEEEEVVGKYNVFQDNIVAQQGHLPLLRRVFAPGETVRFELRYDSSQLQHLALSQTAVVILDVTAFPLKDASGRITHAVIQHMDITERKRAEEALRESEKKYRSLYHEFQGILNAIPDVLCLLLPDLNIVWTNEATAVAMVKKNADLIGRYCYSLRHNRSEPCQSCPVLRCFNSGKIETAESTTTNGLIWELRAVPIYDDLGVLVGAIEVARNITARKQSEEALFKNHQELLDTTQQLEQSRNMLQLIIEAIPVRVFWKDKDLRYLGCNTLFARDAGFTNPRQLLGLDDFAMGWREQAELYRADDRQVMESGLSKMNIVEPQTTPAGANIWLNTSKVPLQRPNGEVFGVLGVYEDITERQQAQETIKTSLRDKEVLLKEIYHRTKNNLQVVSSLLRLQSIRVTDPQLLGAFEDTINRIRSMAMVHEKLYQSKNLSHIDLKDYIQDLAKFLLKSYQTESGKIALHLDLHSVIVNIETAMPCGLIINELISNAIKYAFPGTRRGTISIYLQSTTDRDIELRVGDDGVGLPPALDIWKTDSLGFIIITGIGTKQLGGKLTVRRHPGTEFRLCFRKIHHKPLG
jgi:PAS domain S-box-containing protein